MPKVSLLTHEQKLDIATMHQEGWRPLAILKQLKTSDTRVTFRAVRYFIAKFESGKFHIPTELETPTHRFKKITQENLDDVAKNLDETPFQSAQDVRRSLSTAGVEVSTSTTKRIIKAAGYTAAQPRYCHMVRAANQIKRFDFCQELALQQEDFQDCIFSDESSIQLHDNKTICYRTTDGIAPTSCRPKHPLKIHVWGL